MCIFFSVISDGKGIVKFFKPEDIAKIMSEGNKKNYEWNSHTSVANFFGLTAEQEDTWNKWEYDTVRKCLKAYGLNTTDDKDLVKTSIEDFLKDKDLSFMMNLYNHNSGDQNSGHRNSGNCNSGTTIGSFCSKKQYFLFNKSCSEKDYAKIGELNLCKYFNLNMFIYSENMTKEEKIKQPEHSTISGYLKNICYKEAWKVVPKDTIEKIKKLKNFNKKVFREITGLEV